MLSKRLMLSAALVILLTGCESSEDEAVAYRLKSVDYLDTDNNQIALMVYNYSAGGLLSRLNTYTGKGADGIWGTLDDVMGYYSTCSFSGSGAASYRDYSVEYSALPLEPTAQTDWKALKARPINCVDGVGAYPMANEVTYNTAAGVPDVEEGRYQFERVSTNSSRWTTQVSTVITTARSRDFFYVLNSVGGLEGILVEEKTGSSSVFTGYYKYTFNSEGKLSRRELRNSPGVNTKWGDADDTIRSYEQITRSGNIVTLRFYTGAGADGTWFNSNDTQSGYIIYQYDGSTLQLEAESSNAGTDGLWETDDDVLIAKRYNYEKI
ncbi:MAG TPA: hypothetical protein PKY03_09185 [Moraxellaceae bacterium]|nr:hypothetical protein [Moraxellaceae bacterium]